MAVLKLLNNKSSFSLSQGFRNYFYCCFPSSDTNASPTRSTEGVLKADELGKHLSDEDDGSLVRRRSLIADNFGYESDPSRQVGSNESNAAREITLENCKPSAQSSEASEKSHIVDHASGAQRHDSSTTAVKKGLNSLLAIAEQATKELNADEEGQARESEEPDNRSGNSNPDGAQDISDDLQPILEGAGVKATVDAEDARVSSTVSSLTEENKKLGSTDDTAGLGGSVQTVENPNAAAATTSVAAVAAAGGAAKNANLEIVDVADGHLFDISDLQHNNSAGSSVVSLCGSVLIALSHDSHVNRMSINVKEARDLPSRERGGVNQAQIRTLLLPLRKTRHKTKVVVANDSTSLFNETFECKVPTDELTSMGLRVRLYGCERLRKDRLIGETIINFTQSNTNGEHFWAHLEPRSNLSHGDSLNSISSLTHSESDSSTHSLQHGGTLELMLGLAYNGVTGRLSVEVIKGSNFKNAATKRPPDTFVRMELKGPDGERITHSKTTIRRGHPNPLFKETFMFQVAQSQLNDVSLHVSVFVQKSLKRKEMIGWFTMGSTNSSDDDGAHWSSMLESKGEQVCKWHALLEP